MRWIIGLLLIIGGAVGAAANLYAIHWQHRAVRNFIPVDCTILSARILPYHGRGGPTFTPLIHYTYTYQGQTFDSYRVRPVDESFSELEPANAILARYPPATAPATGRSPATAPQPTIAYIDPASPANAVLIRQYSFTPYLIAIMSLLALLLGAALLAGTLGGPRSTIIASPDRDTTFRLRPTHSFRSQFRKSLIRLVAVSLATALPLLHWILVAGQGDAVAIALVETLLIGALFFPTWRYWSLSRHISEARLTVDPCPVVRGEPVTLELTADAYAPLQVQEARAKIVCTEHSRTRTRGKTHYSTRIVAEHAVVLSPTIHIPAGGVLTGKGETVLSTEDAPPTSDRWSAPYYVWEIHLTIKLRGAADYNARFPVKVL